MSDSPKPQLPPSSQGRNSLVSRPELEAVTEKWFEIMVRVQPHHTDYGGVVWHGTYLTWLETARVECLRSIGVDFADLVKLGCDLPVVSLALRYHRAIRLGQTAVIKVQMQEIQKVRLEWQNQIVCLETGELCVTGKITLVAIDPAKGKIMRRLPPVVQENLLKLRQ
ncbi:acyl-CoA thioesterase [Synechocystis salina LEGE 06099]|uniref:acyl-CoA thioesterase n=1 Tax=Synechocystis salina TaxID=945780 RepID=UPI001880D074|nr:thioesterase family protein [Synechocystis salina]MBE9203264.1 acyl-CoA thioesterase [Synechocystis salina LEGE 06099]